MRLVQLIASTHLSAGFFGFWQINFVVNPVSEKIS